MSVDSEQQVVKLGTSTDMGFCRSRKKVTSCLLLPTILAFSLFLYWSLALCLFVVAVVITVVVTTDDTMLLHSMHIAVFSCHVGVPWQHNL